MKDVTEGCAECTWVPPHFILLTELFFLSFSNSKCVAAFSKKIVGKIHETDNASNNVRSSNKILIYRF